MVVVATSAAAGPQAAGEAVQRKADLGTAAENRTSGEILAVVTAESASHLSVPFLIASLVALIVPWPLIYFTLTGIHVIYAIQLAVFAVLLAVLLPRQIRFRLVPRSILESRAHRRAVEQFLTLNLHTSPGQTGVLIFVSVAERYAEIIADGALHAKVEPSAWKQVVDELTRSIGEGRPGDGFVKAIESVAEPLARHFPPGSGNTHAFPDHLVVLD